jgi:GntR family transcriptional repressor for pyruvate dehydrogenase complex
MSSQTLYKYLKSIPLEKPSDNIIRQIRNLVISGKLKSGDKLPPERRLAETFCVGRCHFNEAINKLEFGE